MEIKHPLAIRWFHWINFPVLAIMIWSGLLIYWANDVYKIGFGSTTLLKFFPNSFYQALNIPYRLSEGMAYHFVFMWLFFLNGIAYVLYTAISGEWRLLLPDRRSFKQAWHVLLHDLRIRKMAPVIDGKYNGAQRIAYTAIIIMGIGSILTGLAIYKPVQLEWLCQLLGGYKFARILHFALTIGYVLFFLVHVFQVIRAGWKNFKAMVTGSEQLNPKKTIIAFGLFFLIAGAGFFSWRWLRTRPVTSGMTNTPIRKVLNANESIFSGWLSDKNLAKEYPVSKAVPARVNGNLGLKTPFDPLNWSMQVTRAKGDTLKIKLEDIKKLPKTEIIFNFKCIEGWSQITYWGGVRFSEFMKAYNLNDESAMKYLGLATPDKEYYVGIDMPSAMHPQTLLCYELNGKPLPDNQGYPLRLIIPVKYGVKSLKRIGYMYFDNKRTPDYWADVKGYDYFSGL